MESECMVCRGPVSSKNMTGVCTRTAKCRKKNRQIHDRDYDENRRPERTPGVKRPKYPSCPSELFEDGIVDQIAIEIAVNGIRRVRLTPTEQKAALAKMVRLHLTYAEIRNNLGIASGKLNGLLNEIGYEAVVDPMLWHKRMLITRIDRNG